MQHEDTQYLADSNLGEQFVGLVKHKHLALAHVRHLEELGS